MGEKQEIHGMQFPKCKSEAYLRKFFDINNYIIYFTDYKIIIALLYIFENVGSAVTAKPNLPLKSWCRKIFGAMPSVQIYLGIIPFSELWEIKSVEDILLWSD